MMIRGSSSKAKSPLLILLSLPRLKEIVAVAKHHGFSSREVERWLGVSIDKFWLFTYHHYDLSKETHLRMESFLRDYEPCLYNALRPLDTLNHFIFEIKCLDDFTLVVKCLPEEKGEACDVAEK